MEVEDQDTLELFLKSWWSRQYNRPLKDPLLQQYTVYELLYEYHDRKERDNAQEHFFELEDDKIEEEQEQAALDWAEEEERKELEEAKAAEEAWMLKELQKEHGEEYGEDVNVDFSG